MMRAFVLSFLVASSAFAHGGQLAAEVLFYEGDELRAVSSNFGLLTATERGFEWSCFDTLTSVPFTGFYHDQKWYAQTRSGLFESADKGCTWSAVEGSLAGQPAATLRVDERGLVASAQRLPGLGQLHRLGEAGFESWGQPLPQGELVDFKVRRVDGAVFALIHDDGQDPAIWFVDSDLGEWSLVASLEGLAVPRFIDLELGDDQLVVAVFRGAAGELWAIDTQNQLSRRAQLPTPVLEGRSSDDEHWVITLTGVPLKAIGNGPFLPAEGPEHCLASKTEQMVACGDIDDGHLALARVPGGFETEYPFSTIVGPACPEAECNARWSQLESSLNPQPDAGPVVDAGPPVEPPSGCGCLSGSTASLGWCLFILALRRRQRC